MTTVRESKRLVCTECENPVYGCYKCSKEFELGQEIKCKFELSEKHSCEKCSK